MQTKQKEWRNNMVNLIEIMKLKLFVWDDFNPDYSSGLAFAIAETEEEAKELVEKERGRSAYEWGCVKVFPIDEKVAFSVGGGS
jgi:hypothetical protein